MSDLITQLRRRGHVCFAGNKLKLLALIAGGVRKMRDLAAALGWAREHSGGLTVLVHELMSYGLITHDQGKVGTLRITFRLEAV